MQLPRISLQVENDSAYCIRKAKRSDSLSTLEAAASALQRLQPSLDVQPVLQLLQALVDTRLARMPTNVRQRYQLD
ncbi:DTW domain-containing protein [Shewanella sp.]|uniref:DTW domain-containing protein n=1 Tax=Shewanella sp. TaxID=50422 RepID=UPI003A96B13E